jgi:hypothetical protein
LQHINIEHNKEDLKEGARQNYYLYYRFEF